MIVFGLDLLLIAAIKCAFQEAARRHTNTKIDFLQTHSRKVLFLHFPSISINTEHEKSFDGVEDEVEFFVYKIVL